MYEIWLILNTFYELALAHLGLVVGVLVVWLALMVVAGMKKTIPWKRGIAPALLVGLAAWVLCCMQMPGWTKSAQDNVTYILDYLALGGIALAFAGLIAAFVWPLYLLVRR